MSRRRIGLGMAVALLGGILGAITLLHAQPPAGGAAQPAAQAAAAPDPAAAADPQAGGKPGDADARERKYLEVVQLGSGITLGKLSNGLTVLVQENHAAPLATVRCYVKNTGSVYESRWLGAGLSHLVEHLTAGGTTSKRSEDEIEAIVKSLGGATNAYTSTDITAYYVDCPSKQVRVAIDLISDSLQHTVFEPSEFAREYEVVQRELEDGEVDRDRVLWNMLQQTIYTQHPARHPVIGYIDVLEKITRDDVVAFYRERYVPNNMCFVVVGDVDTQAVLDQVAKEWTMSPRGAETLILLGEEPRQLAPRESIREMDGETYEVALAFPTVPLSHPDLYALDVASYILTQGESSRMVRKLQLEENALVSVNSASYTPHYANGFFTVMASADAEQFPTVEKKILAELERLKTELVGEAELAKAKKQKAAELVFGRQTVEQMAESLGRGWLSTDDPLFDETYVKNIQKVTAEQIQAVARKYFVPAHLNRVVITPPGQSQKKTEQTAAPVEGVVEKHVLDNGLTVLIKRQAQLPIVTLQAYTLGASLVEKDDQMGLSSLVANMLDQGTPAHSADEIAEYFDGIGGFLSFAAGRNSVYGSSTTMKEDFATAAGYFAECLTAADFPAERFARIQKLKLGQIAAQSAEPQSELMRFFAESLPRSTPYHIITSGTETTVAGLKRSDLLAYKETYLVPNNMVVAVFGDVEPAEALAVVKQHFGGLKKNDKLPKIAWDQSNAVPESIARHKDTAKPTGLVLLAYPAVSMFDEKDYAALSVLDTVMSGYSYPGGWLHSELRGEGLVYMVHAMQMTGPAPGYFIIMAQTQPDKIETVIQKIRAKVEVAKNGEITPEEFALAKETIINLHAQEKTTIQSQAQQAALDQLYGLGYDYDEGFDARITAVTLDEVKAVAKKYFKNSIAVSTGPAARAEKASE